MLPINKLPTEIVEYTLTFLPKKERKRCLNVNKQWRAVAIDLIQIDAKNSFFKRIGYVNDLLQRYHLPEKIKQLNDHRFCLEDSGVSSLKDLFFITKMDELVLVDMLRDIDFKNIELQGNTDFYTAKSINMIEESWKEKGDSGDDRDMEGIQNLILARRYNIALTYILNISNKDKRDTALKSLYNAVKETTEISAEIVNISERLSQIDEKKWSFQFSMLLSSSITPKVKDMIQTMGGVKAIKHTLKQKYYDENPMLLKIISRLPRDQMLDAAAYVFKIEVSESVKEKMIFCLLRLKEYTKAVQAINQFPQYKRENLFFNLIRRIKKEKEAVSIFLKIVNKVNHMVSSSTIYTFLTMDHMNQENYFQTVKMANKVTVQNDRDRLSRCLVESLFLNECDEKTFRKVISKLNHKFKKKEMNDKWESLNRKPDYWKRILSKKRIGY